MIACDESSLEHDVRSMRRPPPIARLPRMAPLSCAIGASPASAAACSPVIGVGIVIITEGVTGKRAVPAR